jgi:hypothetical protein
MSKDSQDVIVKTMTINKNLDEVYNFFINIENWEKGGALSNIRKNEYRDVWEVDTPVGKARIKLKANHEFGILDHEFIGSGGDNWVVFCRIIESGKDSVISWIFIKPAALSNDEFKNQLLNFDKEMQGWKKALED